MNLFPIHREQGRSTQRSDAQQNRTRLLEVARSALLEAHDASLNSIAKQAGVGIGTLYRHFPTREALMLAVYRHDVQELVDAAPALLAAHPPQEALRLWFGHLAWYGQVKHGLAGAFSAATSADLSGEYYGQVVGAIRLLLNAGQTAGVVRPDIEADEVLLMLGFLWRIDSTDWQQRSRHMLDVVMDGLLRKPETES